MDLDKENERKNDSGPPVKTNRRGNTGRVRNASPWCREILKVVSKSPMRISLVWRVLDCLFS